MNRAMRRQQAKASTRKAPRRRTWSLTNRPMLHEIDMVFAPMDMFLAQLSTGEVECDTQGRIFFRDPSGDCYEAVPAVRGFIAVWQRLSDSFGLGLDATHAAKVCNRLEACMPIRPVDVEQFKEYIHQCRKRYAKLDVSQVKSVVTTELIAIEMGRASVVF